MNKDQRRKDQTQIKMCDAIIYFHHLVGDNTDIANVDPTKGGEAVHIAAVADIKLLPDNKIDLTIMESAGSNTFCSGTGVNYRILQGEKISKASDGLVYMGTGRNRAYFVGKKTNVSPYMPYGVSPDYV